MSLHSEIEELLGSAIGLDISSVGADMIARAVGRRILEVGATNTDAYLSLLRLSREELMALVEEVVVPETWFFRNVDAFKLLRRFVTTEWRRAHPGGVARILSIPCSTGEEPYAIAMTMLDAGLAHGEFQVDAVDVSTRAIAKARYGVYGKNSFRGESLALCKRFVNKTDAGYTLDDSVKRAVTFHRGNILDAGFMSTLGSYDVIFCRNLLIYFNSTNQRRTARILSGMLKDDGLLFVGHAESGQIWQGLFTSARYPMAFAYRKFNDDRRTPAPGSVKPARKTHHRTERRKTPPPLAPRNARVEPPPPPPPKRDETTDLASALELANTGRTNEASAMCEAYLEENGASAEAYFILGLISDTEGNGARAADYLKRTIYLEPNHYEALVHLSLILEGQGDTVGAERLKARSRRLHERLASSGAKDA